MKGYGSETGMWREGKIGKEGWMKNLMRRERKGLKGEMEEDQWKMEGMLEKI